MSGEMCTNSNSNAKFSSRVDYNPTLTPMHTIILTTNQDLPPNLFLAT